MRRFFRGKLILYNGLIKPVSARKVRAIKAVLSEYAIADIAS